MNSLPSPQATRRRSTNAKLFIALALTLTLTTPFWPPLSSAQRSKPEAGAASVDAFTQAHITHQLPDSEPPQRHVLAASHYSVKGKLSATLMFNNKSPQSMDARLTLFSLDGQRLEVPPVTVEPVSHRTVDLRDYAAAGSPFEEGSLQVVYYGKPLQMGAQVRVVDDEHSLSSDEQLTYPVQASSTRRAGVWRLPSRTCSVRLILSNVSNEQITVNTNEEAQSVPAGDLISLMSHETRVIDLRETAMINDQSLPEIGHIHLEHSGPKGALMARVLVQDAGTGYSVVAELLDPEKSRSSRLHGAGLRLGKVAGEELTPEVVARNIGDSPTTVTGRIPYTRRDGGLGFIPLPKTQLAPGQAKAVNVAAAVHGSRFHDPDASVGLEFEYTGEPGSVVMSAQSTGSSANQVFRVPLLDPAAQRSSTGGYPWIVDGDQSTIVYLKNTTDLPQRYVAHLKSAGGTYMIGQKILEPGRTVDYDIRALRYLQIPDENGNVIPLDATHGHFKWSVILEEDDADQLVMIGRAEHFNLAQAMSSTYACASCCPDGTVDSYVLPFFTVEVFADEMVDFDAVEVKADCYGDEYHSIRTLGVSWNSGDSEVSSVNSSGIATALNGGESDIEAVFMGRYYYNQECYPGYGAETDNAASEIQPNLPGCGGCRSNLAQQRPRGRLRVKPRITSITPARGVAGAQTGVTIAGRGFGSNPSVLVGGTGVSYSGSGSSASQLTGNLTVAGNATGGNHTVEVSNKGQKSNSVNFFVQVPSEFIPLSLNTANLGCPAGAAGFGAEVNYQVADQSGQVISVAGMTPQEHFTVNGTPAFPGFRAFATPPTTSATGTFLDTPIGTCAGPPAPPFNFCVDVIQTFNIVVGSTTFNIPTVTTRRDCMQGMRVVVVTGATTRTSSLGTVN